MRKITDTGLLATGALVFFACVPGAAVAQNPSDCIIPPPPFELTERNRVSPERFRREVVERKTFVFERRHKSRPLEIRMSQRYRSDGSTNAFCHNRFGTRREWTPCPVEGIASGRLIGVWTVSGRNICERFVEFRQTREACYTLHEQGGQWAFKHVSGALCMEGPVSLE